MMVQGKKISNMSRQWVEEHRVPISEQDTSLATSTRRRVLTGADIRKMIEEAVAKDRVAYRAQIREQLREKIRSVRSEINEVIDEMEQNRENETRIQNENDRLRREIDRLTGESSQAEVLLEEFRQEIARLEKEKAELQEQLDRVQAGVSQGSQAATELSHLRMEIKTLGSRMLQMEALITESARAPRAVHGTAEPVKEIPAAPRKKAAPRVKTVRTRKNGTVAAKGRKKAS